MTKGIFGDLFDFNGDGELDAFEMATEFMLFNELMKDDEDDDCDEFDDGNNKEDDWF